MENWVAAPHRPAGAKGGTVPAALGADVLPERDVYFAAVPGANAALPAGDVLAVVQGYASRVYERLMVEPNGGCLVVGGRHVNERSVDERALLGVGRIKRIGAGSEPGGLALRD